MKLYEAAGASVLKNFSLKDLSKEDIEQAIINGGYNGIKLESSRFSSMNIKNEKSKHSDAGQDVTINGSHIALYLVTYKDDGSFDSESERKNQKVYLDIDMKTGKIVADF